MTYFIYLVKQEQPHPGSEYNPLVGGAIMFKFRDMRKLQIEGCATKEDLTHP